MFDNYTILKNKEEFPKFDPETAGIRESDWQVTSRDASAGAVVRIDSVSSAFAIEETLWEQKEDVGELHCDHDGYLFSFIRTFQIFPEFVLPDRADMTPNTHFLRALSQLVVATGLRRGVRVSGDVGEAQEQNTDQIEGADLLLVPRGRITERGMRANIHTALTQSDMEANLATAQLWQWVRHETGVLDEGRIVTPQLFGALLDDETRELGRDSANDVQAQELAEIVLAESFTMRAS